MSVLSRFSTGPAVAESWIRKSMGWGIQINKRTVRMIKLERLMMCEVGTGRVEKLAEKLAVESRGGRREKEKSVRRKVRMLMVDKVRDAKEDLKLGKVHDH